MTDRYELASAIFGTKRAETDPSTLSTAIITGTAVEDSESGMVRIIPDGNVIAPEGEDNSIVLPTSPNVKSGDNVIIISTGGTATTPIVAGASGSGDRLLAGIDGIETLIRETADGVLVAKVGQTVGALVNADGSFDVVALTWDGSEPTVGNPISSFGENVEVGSIYVDSSDTGQEISRRIDLLRIYDKDDHTDYESPFSVETTFIDEDWKSRNTVMKAEPLTIEGYTGHLSLNGYSGELLVEPYPYITISPNQSQSELESYLSVNSDLRVNGEVIGTVDWSNIVNAPPSVEVDAAISATSENPVQNKAISTALSGKQETMDAATNADVLAMFA